MTVADFLEHAVHPHDCSCDIYLGNMPAKADSVDEDAVIDLYLHPASGYRGASVIARYGPEGQYLSSTVAISGLDEPDHHLDEALRRAVARRLI